MSPKKVKKGKEYFWQDYELETLVRLAGKSTLSEIQAELLEDQCVRSIAAIKAKLIRMDIDGMMPGMSAIQVAQIFGVAPKRLMNWVRNRNLKISRLSNHFILIQEKDVREFIRNYPYLYDWKRLPLNYRALGQTTWQANPYVTCQEAAQLLGITLAAVRHWCKRGKLPYVLGYSANSANQQMIRLSHIREVIRDEKSSRIA